MKTHSRPHEVWSADARLDRWHRIWIATLEAQAQVNPNLPTEYADQIANYRNAADEFRDSDLIRSAWWDDYDTRLKACRHEVVAALNTLNSYAGASAAHLGLTSCDVTETANQLAIRESFWYVHHRTCQLARLIADRVATERETRMVARTHGQPAQLTTLGYRYATLLEPLNEWVERFAWYAYEGYGNRPMAGAVGTWADQSRVLVGWQPAENAPATPSEATGSASKAPEGIETAPGAPTADGEVTELLGLVEQVVPHLRVSRSERVQTLSRRIAELIDGLQRQETSGNEDALTRRVPSWDTSYPGAQHPDVSRRLDHFQTRTGDLLGIGRRLETSRQVYHRSADLHWMALLAELASIAETWATDRRLESILGLGRESFGDEQVGSSAMPHKQNPRFAERICALAAVTRSHLTAFAELASQEWLEGDVSGSAARRQLLADAFENIDALLQNWTWLVLHWEPNHRAIDGEADRYVNHLATGALIQAAIEVDGSERSGRMSRVEAHECIRSAFATMANWNPANSLDSTQLAFVLADIMIWPLTEAQTREVIDRVTSGPIGDIVLSMSAVITVAEDRHQTALDLKELGQWLSELR